MTLSDSRKLLARLRLKHMECVSTPEMADALQAALMALDGRTDYSEKELREWLKPKPNSAEFHPV